MPKQYGRVDQYHNQQQQRRRQSNKKVETKSGSQFTPPCSLQPNCNSFVSLLLRHLLLIFNFICLPAHRHFGFMIMKQPITNETLSKK